MSKVYRVSDLAKWTKQLEELEVTPDNWQDALLLSYRMSLVGKILTRQSQDLDEKFVDLPTKKVPLVGYWDDENVKDEWRTLFYNMRYCLFDKLDDIISANVSTGVDVAAATSVVEKELATVAQKNRNWLLTHHLARLNDEYENIDEYKLDDANRIVLIP